MIAMTIFIELVSRRPPMQNIGGAHTQQHNPALEIVPQHGTAPPDGIKRHAKFREMA
jgi:hypothetical protein